MSDETAIAMRDAFEQQCRDMIARYAPNPDPVAKLVRECVAALRTDGAVLRAKRA